jgi:hypothetical protein
MGIDEPTGTPPTHAVTVSLRCPNRTLCILDLGAARKISVISFRHDACLTAFPAATTLADA